MNTTPLLTRTLGVALVSSVAFIGCGDDDENTVPETTQSTVVDLAVATDALSTLVDAVTAADLAGTLSGDGPFTVFAPTNDAFADALAALNLTAEELLADTETLTDILLYHVAGAELFAADVVATDSIATLQGASISVAVDGETVTLDGTATVTTVDVDASNGVVHIIDAVLLPPADEPGANTIVDLAIATDALSTLVDAVVAADLDETLAGDGPFTVFAPTNDAFADALAALNLTAEELLADTETLTDILLYHVAGAELFAADVVATDSIATLQGASISVAIDGETVTLDETATVTTVDVDASNGVVHIIDAVLLPPTE